MELTLDERRKAARKISAPVMAGTIRAYFPFWDALHRPQLLEAARRLPARHFDFKPHPSMLTARQFLIHIAEAEHGWIENILNGGADQEWVAPHDDPSQGWKETIDAPDHAALFELLERWHRPTQEWLDKPAAELSREFEWPRAEGDRGRATLHWILDHVQEHELHHRAQLFLYLRLLGIEPPHV